MKPGMSTSLRPKSTEQQKTREILSFTNAAVQALSDPTVHEEQEAKAVSPLSKKGLHTNLNGSSSNPSISSRESLSSDQRAVLKLGCDLSSSSSSQSLSGQGASDRMDLSSLDSSFNKSTAVRVRVPSRMLREIKQPLDRSVDRSGVDRAGGELEEIKRDI